MNHFRGNTLEIKKNPFNAPISVRWSARFEPEVEGKRSGIVRISMGDSSKSVVIRALAAKGGISCDLEALQGVVQSDARVGGAGSYQRLELTAAPKFARAFLHAVKSRIEREWSAMSGSLKPDGRHLVGHGNVTIQPQEWGQNHDEVLSVPYVRMVSVAMGGLNKRR